MSESGVDADESAPACLPVAYKEGRRPSPRGRRWNLMRSIVDHSTAAHAGTLCGKEPVAWPGLSVRPSVLVRHHCQPSTSTALCIANNDEV